MLGTGTALGGSGVSIAGAGSDFVTLGGSGVPSAPLGASDGDELAADRGANSR